MTTALTKLAPSWHAEAITMLRQNFDQIHSTFLDATKKAVWLGMFLEHIKEKGKADGSIPHGEFVAWVKSAVPEVSERSARVYMELATNVCKKGKFEISDFRNFAELGKLPAPILQIIEGKTQHQLLLEFRGGTEHQHHPRKALAPEEIVEAEEQQAREMLESLLTPARLIHSDLQSKHSLLVSRIPAKDWKLAVQTITAVNKAMKPLARRKSKTV